ncbi:SPFH domain-containing protein [Massilia rhizosphaerae]|uniref:SPFH domain-containing protein n=1 Tax=Massilia rhizosphaerae TaxID=2784389 RepID=UPI0018DB9E8B|nr:SPFH domain-containing protein [Massilia rhizosphaerae]
MLRMFGLGGAKCPRCAKAQGAADGYCAGCGLMLGTPRHAPVLVENRWVPGPDELAVFFGVRALSGVFVKTLRVPATARAYILQGENATEVPQGEYEIEGFFTRLNHLLRDQHAEILVTRSSALPVDFELEGLASAEHLEVTARLALSVRIENVPAFARHFMTMPGTVKSDHLRELLQQPVRQLAAEFVAARSLREMAGQRELRPELDQHLQGGLAALLADVGLAIVRVETLALRHDRFDANRARIGSLWLAVDEQRVKVEHARQLDELYTDDEWRRIAREESAARLAHRRAELRQGASLERAEMTLQNAERAQAIRAREIELYGRIVEAKSRKQAIERGAQDLVAELEHELAHKRGARADQETEWAHLRELAAVRMREEVALARQDAAQARTVAAQRFTHQLLQQQIRNKIEQARGIEDAARQRAELARLHAAEEDAARRARDIEAEDHAGRLRLLELANAARRRGAERALEWDDAQGAARLRAAERVESVDAEQVRQRVEALRREGSGADALAQHEKLLRTIAADAALQDVTLDGERARAALQADALNAERAHELRRMETMGAVDDATKLALAASPNAALLADVLKARTQAGMSAEQLAAQASVSPQEAMRLAEEHVARERERRDAEQERERRHQLELLALQNDVNKAALATQAQLGTGLVAGAAALAQGQACRHADAQAGDRFCGRCGAPLPARG